jgi:hypothetical protein
MSGAVMSKFYPIPDVRIMYKSMKQNTPLGKGKSVSTVIGA